MDSVLQKLSVSRYEEEDRQPPYFPCLKYQEKVDTLEEVLEIAPYFQHELNRYGVMTVSVKGHPLPDVILLQALGGQSYVIHWYKIREFGRLLLGHTATEDRLRMWGSSALEFLFTILESPQYIKFGCNIGDSLTKLQKAFGRAADYKYLPNVFGSMDLFNYNKSRHVYSTTLMSCVGKTMSKSWALGLQSLLHNQFDFQVYKESTFTTNKIGDWKDLPSFRKDHNQGTPALLRWRQEFLEPKQLLYCYLETVTLMRMFLQSVWYTVQKEKVKISPSDDMYQAIESFTVMVWSSDYDPRGRNQRKIEEAVEFLKKPRKVDITVQVLREQEAERRRIFKRKFEESSATTGPPDKQKKCSSTPDDDDLNLSFSQANEVLGQDGSDTSKVDQPSKQAVKVTSSTGDKSKAKDTQVQGDRSETKDTPVQGDKSETKDTPAQEDKSETKDSHAQADKSTTKDSQAQEEKSKTEDCSAHGNKSKDISRSPSIVDISSDDQLDVSGQQSEDQEIIELVETAYEADSETLVSGDLVFLGETSCDKYLRLSTNTYEYVDFYPSEDAETAKLDQLSDDRLSSKSVPDELKSAFRDAIRRREKLQLNPHFFDLMYPGDPIRRRYLCPKKKAVIQKAMEEADDIPPERQAKYKREKRQKEEKNLLKELKTRNVLEHLQPETFFTWNHCKDCGGAFHSANTKDCPVTRYQLGQGLLACDQWASPDFFTLYPCLYCEGLDHTTVVCAQMHAYCQACRVRGHKQGEECSKPMSFKAYKFKRLAPFGIRTRTAAAHSEHTDGAKWAFEPSKDLKAEPGRMSPLPRASDFTKFVFDEKTEK